MTLARSAGELSVEELSIPLNIGEHCYPLAAVVPLLAISIGETVESLLDRHDPPIQGCWHNPLSISKVWRLI
jgi:hypothetical protein